MKVLHLILGCAGSGKTFQAQQLLYRLAEEGREKLMLLVPEQYSFESERSMLSLLGPEHAQRVSVTSFTRLTDLVFRQYGGIAGKRLDDGGRSILMSLALEELSDQLPLYRRHARTPELASLMLSISTEMKMCAQSPERLLEISAAVPDSTLREKTKEIALILSAYDALVARTYLDPLDDLTRLAKKLREEPFFSGYTVAVDSFKGFTAQEFDVLECILRQAGDVYVTLCADRIDDPENGMGLFSLVRKTAQRLIRIAKNNNIAVAAPEYLAGGVRFRDPALAALERSVFRPGRESYPEKTDAVTIYQARDCYDEAEFAALTIRRLVMEHGYRYRDFAIIVRSMESYHTCLPAALERWKVPAFLDRPRAIDAEPLMRLVLGAFRIVRGGFQSDDVLAWLKTGLAGFSQDEISELENYVFLWKISGRKWREEWTENPRGFLETFGDEEAEILARVNDIRKRITEPLAEFSEAVRDTDGDGIARAVYRLLERIGAAESLKHLYRRLKDCGQHELAGQQVRLWDMLMEILDQTALVLRERRMDPQRYADLLRQVIRAGDIASIPQGLDEVTVGVADRVRPHEPKVVFLLGAAQGEFPQTAVQGGVFSTEERRELIRLGLTLADTPEDEAVEERFLAYSSMCSPSERLYLSAPSAGLDGEAKSPSVILSEALSALPHLRRLNALFVPPQAFASAPDPAFELAARSWRQDSPMLASLREVLGEREGFGPRLEALERAGNRLPMRLESPVCIRDLMEGGQHVSASQIETYHLCRFQYFCRYGLGARERRPAEMNPLEYGSLMHYLLENTLKNEGSEKLAAMSGRGRKKLVAEYIEKYVEKKMGGKEGKSPRFNFLFDRLADSAQVVIGHIAAELTQSRFQPAEYELELRPGGKYHPLRIPLPDGSSVSVEGKIDRLDVLEKDGETYLRVIDYKTGGKDFKLSDVLSGLNMQMLLYLAAVIESAGAEPAGVLYMPASRPFVPARHSQSKEEIRREAEKRLRMTGLVLDDPEIITAMEEKAEGKYIPVALKDGKPARRDNVVDRHEMGRLLGYIRKMAARMALTLREGDVAADPLKGGRDACQYCPYFAICGHERDDGGRDLLQCGKAEALKRMEQEDDDE